METDKEKTKTITLDPLSAQATSKIKDEIMLDEKLDEISTIGRKLVQLELKRDQRIAKAKNVYQRRLASLRKSAGNLFDAILKYAQKNRSELLPANRKSLNLTHGVLGWRTNPSYVKLKVSEEVAVAFLKEKGYEMYVRKLEWIDVEALRKKPELAKSLSAVIEYHEGKEAFFIKPAGIQVKFTQRMKSLANKVSNAIRGA